MKGSKLYTIILGAIALIHLSACVSIPDGAVAVSPFDQQKYLGKWYEIARLDFKYERNLNNVTANYSLNDDGSIKVDNKGYNYVEKEWKQSIGKAKPVGEPTVGRLKVSFFGPFYSGYNIIALDKHYQYALVAGDDLKNLWILSRTTAIPLGIKKNYLQKAKDIGFDTNALIWVKHDK